MVYRELERGRRVSFNVKLVAHSNFLASRLCHIDNDVDITYVSVDTLSNNTFAVYSTNWEPLIVSIPWRKIYWSNELIDEEKYETRALIGKSSYGMTKNDLDQAVRFCVTRAYLNPVPEILRASKNHLSNSLPVNVIYASLYEPTVQYLGFRLHRLVYVAFFLLLAIIITGFGVAVFGVRPIVRLGAAAKKITPEDPKTRLPINELPNELIYLAERINEAFDRLATALTSEQKFTASAAHELRSPVAGLVARLDTLLRSENITKDLKERIIKIHKDAERLKRLSGQLLLLARLDRAASGETFPKEKIDLNEIVADAVDFCRALAEQKNITIENNTAGKIFIEGHEEWLLRAVYNLIDNAVKYSFENSKITVNTNVQNGNVILTIADEGKGVPKEEREKILERFYRSTNAKNIEGTGIGLAIVYDVVKAHKGKISIDEKLDGAGAVFTIVLPGKISGPLRKNENNV